MSKSYVTMEQKMCIVCGELYETDAILLDKRLRDKFEMHTTTGYGVCKKHVKKGYVLLIEINPDKSNPNGDNITPEHAYKTGVVCHIKNEAFKQIFNTSLPKNGVGYVDSEVIKQLNNMKEDTNG